jgi:hypothetical protein
MPNVRVVSPLAPLARLVADHLQTAGHAAQADVAPEERMTIRFRKGLAADARHALLEQLRPLEPSVESVGELDVDAELRLGGAGFDAINLRVEIETSDPTDELQALLESLGPSALRVQPAVVLEPTLVYGGAPSGVRQILQWIFTRRGAPLVETRRWHPSDMDVVVRSVDRELAARSARDRFKIQIRADDNPAGARLGRLLHAHGFHYEIVPLPVRPTGRIQRFAMREGAFSATSAAPEAAAMRELFEKFLGDEGIDITRYPVVDLLHRAALLSPEEENQPAITLPFAALRRGVLRPYGGSPAAQYDVVIRTDDAGRARPLAEALVTHGFLEPRIEALPADRCAIRVTAGSLRGDRPRLDVLRTALAEVAAELTSKPVELRHFESEDDRVVIDLPFVGHDDGSLERRELGALRRWHVHIHHADGDPTALVAALRGAGFRMIHVRATGGPGAAIHYGGAPDAALDRVTSVCREHATFDPERECAWTEGDRDIYIHLPEGALHGTPRSDSEPERPETVPDLGAWVYGSSSREARPFVERIPGGLRLGRLTLNSRTGERHPLTPSLREFDHYCVDAITAETLLHVARAAALREPCLLEGETSTAKTSAVLFVAAQLGQPIVRLNLNGQSDTGELIGRYVPDDDGGFRWLDGLVVRAMREGLWLLLDEVNLAEPQVLERLNSLLEREPSLVVSEHLGERLGKADIHRDFRVFATMNPAEYAGRAALSPAWRDRWRARRIVPRPTEAAIEQFLRAGVFGETPAIEVAGARWPAGRVDAPWGKLAVVGSMAPFLSALARFHVSLERSLASGRGPGGSRREPYVVTRRNLLSVLDWLAAHLPAGSADDERVAMREALVRYYLQPVARGDRAAVVRLLDAAGIGPTTWTLDAPAGAAPKREDDASESSPESEAPESEAPESEAPESEPLRGTRGHAHRARRGTSSCDPRRSPARLRSFVEEREDDDDAIPGLDGLVGPAFLREFERDVLGIEPSELAESSDVTDSIASDSSIESDDTTDARASDAPSPSTATDDGTEAA